MKQVDMNCTQHETSTVTIVRSASLVFVLEGVKLTQHRQVSSGGSHCLTRIAAKVQGGAKTNFSQRCPVHHRRLRDAGATTFYDRGGLASVWYIG